MVFFVYTEGRKSREIEATRGHSSILLDQRLNPRKKGGDAGEDCIVLLAATLSQSSAHDPNKNVATLLICGCERSTAVTLGQK